MTFGGTSAKAIAGRWTTSAHTHHLRTEALYTRRGAGRPAPSRATVTPVPAILSRLRARLRRSGSQLVVRPAVDNLGLLGRHDAALSVANVGRTPVTAVVVSIQAGHATFAFDPIHRRAPAQRL